MLSDQIRAQFLEFFQERGHLLVASAPLVPRDDPSLLLVSAGMVPFKPYFLGLREPPGERLTSCQKSFRTVDIEEVGSSYRHDTFFEMLGNFSFGAYFKAEAISYAHQLLTQGFGLNPDRLSYTVHPQDQDSAALWQKVAGVPESRVVPLEDNFWQAGPTGPCGVDSEIYYDLGDEWGTGPEEQPGRGNRFLEIWNLVFMDKEQFEDGTVRPLRRRGVDTGMGLERMAMVLQGKRSIFDTDLFLPIMDDFAQRARRSVRPAELGRHLRILADHTRGACCLIADGVLPSNEGRGYVLRRILRRALVSAQSLDVRDGLGPGAGVVAKILGRQYPNLEEQMGAIQTTLAQEQERFQEAVARGLDRFSEIAEGAVTGISGDDAFRLHDTFGFPIELTLELAAARGLQVDQARFEELLGEQRQRGRAGRAAGESGVTRMELPANRFVGYEVTSATTRVLAVVTGGERGELSEPGQEADVVLADNPFYAEGGGQVGDRGRLVWEGGEAEVVDSQPTVEGPSVQRSRLLAGRLAVGLTVDAVVDSERRLGCARHHSATHLLNQALREVLGPGVVQRGSLVAPDHATFDFGWAQPISSQELATIEAVVNQQVRLDLPRRVELLTVEQARAAGALALPDEIYQEVVRVVSFGAFSKELCGGTHVERTGELGAVVLTGSRSVGQGLRRIELLAGEAAEIHWRRQAELLGQLGATMRSPVEQLTDRVRALQDRVRELEKDLRQLRQSSVGAGRAAPTTESVSGVTLAIQDVDQELDRSEMRRLSERTLDLAPTGLAVLFAGGQMMVTISEALVAKGLNAGAMAQEVCRELGGRGGGNQQLGQGAVPKEGHQAALAALRTILRVALEEA
ncbi:MAG: alanine--tRNA ligase [Candidatus Dormibacteria bacterium]